MIARQTLTPVTLAIVAAYVLAIWQIAECSAAISTDGAFVKTKSGEPKPHPAIGLSNRASEIVVRLAGELGLTPAARSRKSAKTVSGAQNEWSEMDV